MKIAAITTFPPSSNPQSSFGYQAIHRFLENPIIHSIVVLADRVWAEKCDEFDNRLVIDRCWDYNTPYSFLQIISAIKRHNPDVVWLNFQYTLFGPKPLSILPGLFLPILIKRMGYPVVLLLHHYLSAVNIEKIGLALSPVQGFCLNMLDDITMRSLISSDKVFVMLESYRDNLIAKYPDADVQFIEQDLYKIPLFRSPNPRQCHIATVGYYGSYKRLEILLNAFALVRVSLPDAKLKIGGVSHPQTPHYLDHLRKQYSPQLENVEFSGYITEDNLSSFFWDANVVTVTNSTNTGSSAVLRYAYVYGRGMVVPYVDLFRNISRESLGIAHYKPGCEECLAETLLDILTDKQRQINMAVANYRRAIEMQETFVKEHIQAFKAVAQKRSRE